MITRGIEVYKDLVKSKRIKRSIQPRFIFSCEGNPTVTFAAGDSGEKAFIRIINKDKGTILYSTNLTPGTFGSGFSQEKTTWKAEAYIDGQLVWETEKQN